MPGPRSSAAARRVPRLPCPPGTSPFRVKGVAFRGLVFLVNRVVPGGMEAFCSKLEDEPLRKFLLQPFVASTRYDIFPMVPAFTAVAITLETPLETLARRTAAGQAQHDARGVYRGLYEGLTLKELPERTARFNRYFYDFGEFNGAELGEGHIQIDFGKVPAFILPWFAPSFVAYCEEAMRILGARDIASESEPVKGDGSRGGYDLVAQRTVIRWKE